MQPLRISATQKEKYSSACALSSSLISALTSQMQTQNFEYSEVCIKKKTIYLQIYIFIVLCF